MRICLFIGLSGCGFISETELLARFDQDGDGFEAVRFGGEDCDDDDRDVHPDALEVCDGQDNDCDGDVDSTALDRRTWYRDLDQDGYGSPSTETPAVSCYPPDGFVGDATDCNDDPEADGANIHPQTVWYLDDDGDGYGDPDHTRITCIQLPGLVDNDEDCDDTDPSMSPETVWWEDADGDGFGNPETGITSCIEHPGSTRADPAFADCEDDDEQVFPGAAIAEPELCTRDADGDGFGALDVGGDAEPGTDCDDERASVYPGAAQDWTDDIDNDCDGQVNVVDDSLADCTLLGGGRGGWAGCRPGFAWGFER